MLRELAEKVDPRHAAMVILDPYEIHGDADPTDGYPFSVPRLNGFIEAARATHTAIVWALDDTRPPWTELENWRRAPRRRSNGGIGLQVVDGLLPERADFVLTKHSFSAFAHGPLDLVLRCRGIRTVMLTGGDVLGSIETTAKDSFVHGYYVVFVQDCVYPAAGPNHEIPLAYMGLRVGTVTTSDEIMRCWGIPGSATRS